MDDQYSITHQGEGVEHVAILRDEQTGREARVAVGYGFNLFSYIVPLNEARSRHADVLYAEAGFPRADLRSTANGTPILAPFPNRIEGGRFTYDGKTYNLPRNDHGINAIHGFAFDRPWRIVEESSEDWITLVGEFEMLRDSPFTEEHWPGNFRVRCELTMSDHQLAQKFTVTNLSDARMPFGLGTHPYFRLTNDLDHCGLIVDAETLVELDATIPTGKTTSVDDKTRLMIPVKHDDIQGLAPISIGDRQLDDVYTGLQRQNTETHSYPFEHCIFVMHEEATVFTTISHGDDFPYVVVYVPPHRSAVCIEPYTCVTNAVNLGETLGLDGPPTGLWHLEPGDSRKTRIMTYAAAFPPPGSSA